MAAFSGIGLLKSQVTGANRLRGLFETLVLGALAATLAYFAGSVLEKVFGG
jgi:hypothetical protein